jgi:exodeoxyribonuclease VII small subunit
MPGPAIGNPVPAKAGVIEVAEAKSNAGKVSADIAAMSFEQALGELQELVKRLERGDNKLDEAIKAYERGAALKRHCEAKLKEAQLKVEKIVLGPDGKIGSEPANFD